MAEGRLNTRVPKNYAWLALGITWAGYIVYVLLTRVEDFGLTTEVDSLWLWLLVRIVSASFWLAVAATILHARNSPPDWNSFLHAFVATALLAVLMTPTLASAKASLLVILMSILSFSLVSGMVCFTIRRPPVAALLGLLLFPGQLLVDTALHLLCGTLPLH